MRSFITILILVALLAAPLCAQEMPPILTVQRAVATAVQNNPQIAAAAKSALAAKARVGIASAPYYPTVGFSAQEQHSSSNRLVENTNTGTVVVNSGTDTSNGQVSVRQAILDFTRGPRLLSAQLGFASSLQDFERVRQDVVLRVREQFFLVNTALEVLEIRKWTVLARELRLRQAEGFYEAGLRARIEVTKAQADLAQAQLEVVRASNALQVGWVTLNVAMGLVEDTRYTLAMDPLDTHVDFPPDRLLALAWENRPELVGLRQRTRAALADLQAVYNDRIPTLSGSASYGRQGEAGFNLVNDSWNVGISVEFNLFNGFLTRHQAEQGRAQAEALVEQTEQTRQQVFQEVRAALVNLREGLSRINAARTSVASARANYELARQRYEVGLGSNLEYTDAQVLRIQAETDLVTATNDYRTFEARLERAVGVYELETLRAALRGEMP
ncbi:MAG: TolC family protein [Armatimonadetes bacterium]|nr:TolC family protein [Armatimonadota bacterium]